jgi:gamma-glutamyl:cysteine ligase YbdK (ATP-grasp superfamily)
VETARRRAFFMLSSSARSWLAAAGARWWAALRAQLDSGVTARQERRLQSAADHVHRLVAELHQEPTDAGVRDLTAALGILGSEADAAVCAGVPNERAEAAVKKAHADAAYLLFDVLAPIVELPDPASGQRGERRAQ